MYSLVDIFISLFRCICVIYIVRIWFFMLVERDFYECLIVSYLNFYIFFLYSILINIYIHSY
jgi:hypothetical protein